MKKAIKRLALCVVLIGGSTFFAIPHASACTGDVCDGLCDFMNHNPKLFPHGCELR